MVENQSESSDLVGSNPALWNNLSPHLYAYAKWNDQKVKYDRVIIISDNESWNEHSVQSIYNEYKKFNDAFVYAIDIQGYGTKDITGGKVFHLTGWSNRLLDFVGAIEKGDTMVDYIKNYNGKETTETDE